MPQNKSGTYYYTPDVKAYVWSTVLNKAIELTEDIIDFNVNRAINATSTASVTLANTGYKYTPGRRDNNWNRPTIINTMDRIVIFLKREDYVQAFSGYVTLAPIASLLPEPINIQAHCTLYKIQNTFWDVNMPYFQAMMPGSLMTITNSTETYKDGGVAQGIVNVLTKVVGWGANKIHVGALPPSWVAQSVSLNEGKANMNDWLRAIDGAGIVAGQNLAGTGANGLGQGNFVTYSGLAELGIPTQAVAIPNGVYTYASPPDSAVAGYVTKSNGENYRGIVVAETVDVQGVITSYNKSLDPVAMDRVDDEWWCVIPWPYSTSGFTADVVQKAKDWLADDGYNGKTGRHIILTSIANARQVVVKATITGDTGGGIIISPKAWKWLAGDAIDRIDDTTIVRDNGWYHEEHKLLDFYIANQVAVSANWAKPGVTRKGKQKTDALIAKRNEFGFGIDETLAQQINAGNVETIKTITTTDTKGTNATISGYNFPVLPTGRTTTTTTTRTVVTDTTMTTRRWAVLCLTKAGFAVNDWNTGIIMSWIGLENTADSWDYRNNPLNCSYNTISSKAGAAGTRKGAYASLDDAAQAWADVINPSDGATPFPQIRAAFSSKKYGLKADVREGIVKAAQWGVANKAQIFYEQVRPFPLTRQLPLTTDCSGFATLCYYLAGAPDPNKLNYNRTGYTGTLLGRGRHIPANEVQIGDLIVYGNGTGDHVAVIVNVEGQYKNDFLTISMGQDSDPSYVKVSQDNRFPKTYLTYELEQKYPSANRIWNPLTDKPWGDTDADTVKRKRILSQAIVSSNWSPTHYGGSPNKVATANQLRAGATAIASQGVGKYGTVIGAAQSSTTTVVNGHSTSSPSAASNTNPNSGIPNFNTSFTQPVTDLNTLRAFGTPRAFITDQPVLASISSICSAGLRDFMSSPTGDFVAWFPDYFGIYGTAPVLNVYDIEIIDFQIYHDDTLLSTHIGVSGDFKNMGSGVDMDDWMMSNGIVSIQIDKVMSQLFGVDVNTLNNLYPPSFSENFLGRYGMRPKIQEMPMIRSHVLEFMYAWRLFQASWAAQYSTQVQFTFLPEIYPGMRIRLADHNLEVYVQSVTHQGSRTGGFTTTAQVTCPITRGTDGKPQLLHFGFPYNKMRPSSQVIQ